MAKTTKTTDAGAAQGGPAAKGSPKNSAAKKSAAKKKATKKASVKKAAAKKPASKKTAVKKKAAVKKTAPGPAAGGRKTVRHVSAADRRQMIAEAAYLRGESQGFLSDERDDWLYAEAEVDALLAKAGIEVRD